MSLLGKAIKADVLLHVAKAALAGAGAALLAKGLHAALGRKRSKPER